MNIYKAPCCIIDPMPRHIHDGKLKEIQRVLGQIKIEEMELTKIKYEESRINANLRELHLRLLFLNGQEMVTDERGAVELLRQFKEIKEDNMSLKQDNKMIKDQLSSLQEKISRKFSIGKVVDRLYDSILKSRKFYSKKEWAESIGTSERSCQNNEKKVEEKLRKSGWKMFTEKNGNSTTVWIES